MGSVCCNSGLAGYRAEQKQQHSSWAAAAAAMEVGTARAALGEAAAATSVIGLWVNV